MKPSSDPDEKRLLCLRERLEVLRSWKTLTKELKRPSLLSEQSLENAIKGVDDFTARLNELDRELENLPLDPEGRIRETGEELAQLCEEMEQANREITGSIENLALALGEEKKKTLEEMDRVRQIRNTAQSYRKDVKGQGGKIDREG